MLTLLATPTPPNVVILPVLILVLSAVPFTFIALSVAIFPITSNASSGASLFIPTRCVPSILMTVRLAPPLRTRMSTLDPSILFCIMPA